jgi:adenine-specific DNA-methyltransferase
VSTQIKAKADFSYRRKGALLGHADLRRLDAYRELDAGRRSEMGQYLTLPPVAGVMASMFEPRGGRVRLLDAGAGVGTLTAAFVAEACRWKEPPREISVTAYEIEQRILPYLEDTLDACRSECERAGVDFSAEVLGEDFIEAGVSLLQGKLLSPRQQRFDCAILNPPYRKINSAGQTRLLLREVGIETSNLYTAFLSIVIRLLEPGGELVAITPRSFCNGPYFKPFRRSFLELMTLRRIHVFDSRDKAFQDDQILQENVIFHAVKGADKSQALVTVTSSTGPEDEDVTLREVGHDRVVRSDDPDSFIHIVPDDLGHDVAEMMNRFTASLEDLGLKVSTGRVVDFRARDFLRAEPGNGTVPLIYPGHFANGQVKWPKPGSKKPNALAYAPETVDLLVPAGYYVLVRRFSAKEERRRVVAAVYDPAHVPATNVGFENHLNYYHSNGNGCPESLVKGLAAFLNSTLVDSYFRQFNGHTQVNATDLRSLRYPTRAELERLGSRIGTRLPGQDELDHLIEEEFFDMPEGATGPVKAKKKIEEGLVVLRALGLPRAQQNERSSLALLALLDLRPETPWSEASDPLRGITQMMDFFAEHYGKRYAPNTRETVRRQTIHQFLEAGFIVINPDDPTRPTNSGKTVYQIEEGALDLLRTFGTGEWEKSLETYLASVETLKERYAQEREMKRIPVTLAPGKTITLSPGGQNVLVEQIVNEFCTRFTPGGKLIYVGDTDEKWAYFDEEALAELGVRVEAHGKMPDLVVYYPERNWLVLVEAVTSHGPVDPKRKGELETLFGGASAELVMVTAFLTRRAMARFLEEIAWESEVWVAESPDRIIHFNGGRRL